MSALVRWRCRFSKWGKLRFTGHRDVARLWERAFRAAQVPVALSAGFSPRPRLSFGLALPTGAESCAEYLDAIIDEHRLVDGLRVEEAWLLERVSAVLPPGLSFDAAMPVATHAPSLQETVVASSWQIGLRAEPGVVDASMLDHAVQRVLAANEVLLARERKGVSAIDDVRPSIESLVATAVDDSLQLSAVLLTQGRALRPGELVRALLPDFDPLDVVARVVRTHQWIDDDGARRELQPAAEMPEGIGGGTIWTRPTRPLATQPLVSPTDPSTRRLMTI